MAQRQTFDISFYCRQSKANKKGYAPVEVSIIINGERNYLTLQRKEIPAEFTAAINSRKTNAIQTFCQNQRKLIDDYVQQMALEGIELTAGNLRECLKRGYVAQLYSLGDMWRDLLDNERAKLKTGDIGEQTYKKYTLAKRALYEANGFTDTTPAKSVELQHINKVQFHLREKGLSQPTIYNYHARTKTAFTLAFERGKIQANPYAGFKMDKGEHKPRIFLTEDELKKIAKKELKIDRLEKVRDLFLFQCYSGLSYSDMALLDKTDYKENKKTKQIYIEKRRKKTNEQFTSIILKEGKAILEKYGYELPVLSNQKYNSYLKEIQDICGIDKELHSHLGRTTYVCYLYNKGTSAEVIAKLVGHSTTKTTLRYYAELDKTTLFNEVEAAEKGKRIAASSGSATLTNETSVNEAINTYFEHTIFNDALPVPKNATLVQLEDAITNSLLQLKGSKETYSTYRVAFVKCATTLKTRLAFFNGKEKSLLRTGDTNTLPKVRLLIKSNKRLETSLKALDNMLFTST